MPQLQKQSDTVSTAPARSRADLWAALACVLMGLLVSLMPHLVWRLHSGSPIWIADNDELLYLSYGSQAYFNHPAYLSDPALVQPAPGMYPWLQLVPGVLVARLFQLGPMAISLIWRAWAGISIALGWYVLARFYTKKVWLAFVLGAFLLVDIGVVGGRPILRQYVTTVQILLGRTQGLLDTNPQIHQEWRIITPGLSLAFLLLHFWLVARARELPTRTRTVLAGLGLGVLFYAYFYFWTAACLGLAIVFLLDARHRKVYFSTACIGVLAGLPALVTSFLIKKASSPDWLVRTDLAVPIPRFSELLVPKVGMVLLVVLFIWIWKWRRDLIHIWAVAVAGMLLLNHQIITFLQMGNFHWTYVWGTCLTFLIMIAVADGLARFARLSRIAPFVIGAFLTAHLGTGLWLRVVEAGKTKESVEFTTTYAKYHEEHISSHFQFAPNAVIAGNKEFIDFAIIVDNLHPLDHYAVAVSPSIDNLEWDSRIALNGFLLGLDRETFVGRQSAALGSTIWGLEARDPVRRAERLADRVSKYDQIVADPGPALARFQVKYVALRKADGPPHYLQSGWRRLADGPYWQVWERE